MTKDTGGNAFPNPTLADADYRTQPGDMGMSLRDYFAAQAVPGIIGKLEGEAESPQQAAELVSRIAYTIADAMLEARK